ncbi:AAA family ATPase [Empedobacter falsenii]|uniref:AAA family ATPase n=2 Tax=Empedobacter falsenii TaxID=343874 RepID=A0AAW7DHY0_9FLAO|nr:AAA family ATPase [Empedobacter falsenii]
MDELVDHLNLEPNSDQYYFNYEKSANKLIFTIGQRYVWRLENDGFKYITNYKTENVIYDFNGLPEAYTVNVNNLQNKSSIINEIVDAGKLELNRTSNSSFKKHNKKDFQELIFNREFRNKVLKSLDISENDSELLINKPMNKITQVLQFKKQIILQGPPGTGKTREAKLIAKELIGLIELKDSDQIKLIQFHPSYTYEDFVRGIISKPNEEGDGIKYEAENKILAEFAKKALDNYIDSKKDKQLITKEIWVKEQYAKFKDNLEIELEKSNKIIIKNGSDATITEIFSDFIKVKRYENQVNYTNLKDNDIINGYIGLYLTQEPIKIKDNIILSKSARSGMYYLYQNLIEKFKHYLNEMNLVFESSNDGKKQKLQDYILIIDEINRANLSSVLGELIYALEYRGESVESMYEVEGENKLILPPNLYIIGTMNTADRSVGHIDYAIRRRFAFVDVLPKDLSNEEGILFDSILFHQVASLFDTNLSPEFEKKDVQLGHSYFIDKSKKGGSMDIRLEYEIKPILLEYVKDGVLIGDEIKQKIEELEASI